MKPEWYFIAKIAKVVGACTILVGLFLALFTDMMNEIILECAAIIAAGLVVYLPAKISLILFDDDMDEE